MAPVVTTEAAPKAPTSIKTDQVTGLAPVIKEDRFIDILSGVPELTKDIGTMFKTSEPVECTESETEYVVKCYKHCFAKHVVFRVRHIILV